jgi:putative membrane protein
MTPSEGSISASDPRVALAAERTLLAWIRTGLALMGFGFVVARFGLFLREISIGEHLPLPRTTGISFWLGGALVVLGVLVHFFAGIQHLRLAKVLGIHDDEHRTSSSTLAVTLTFLLAAFGVAMTVYLVVSIL